MPQVRTMAFLGCTIRNKCAGLFSHTIVPSRGTGWCWGSWATVLAKLSQACVLANYASHYSGFVAGQWSVRELPSYVRHTAKGDRVRASRARGGAAGGVVSPRPCGSKAERLSFFPGSAGGTTKACGSGNLHCRVGRWVRESERTVLE